MDVNNAQPSRVVRNALLAAAMLGTLVSIYSAGFWFAPWLGSPVAGFMLAIVIDVGVFAAILDSRTDRAALGVVAALSLVSWAANAQHALMLRTGVQPTLATWMSVDYVTLANGLVITAVAPLAALALAWLYHRAYWREVNHGADARQDVATVAVIELAQRMTGELDGLREAVSQLQLPAQPANGAGKPMDRTTALAMIHDGAFDHVPNKTQLAMALGVQPSTVGRWPIVRNESGWTVIQ